MRSLLVVCAFPWYVTAQVRDTAVRGGISPFAAAKARTLMSKRLACLGCHQLDGEGGRVGPDLTEVAKRRSAAYIAAIVDDPNAVVPGTSMPRIVMTPQLRAFVLATLVGTTPERVPPYRAHTTTSALSPTPENGAGLYGRYCAACHGVNGRGDGPNAKSLSVRPADHGDARSMSERTDDRLFDAISVGGYPLGKSASMPAFGATLSRAEIWSIVRYLRALCRCAPPAWSTDGAHTPPR